MEISTVFDIFLGAAPTLPADVPLWQNPSSIVKARLCRRARDYDSLRIWPTLNPSQPRKWNATQSAYCTIEAAILNGYKSIEKRDGVPLYQLTAEEIFYEITQMRGTDYFWTGVLSKGLRTSSSSTWDFVRVSLVCQDKALHLVGTCVRDFPQNPSHEDWEAVREFSQTP